MNQQLAEIEQFLFIYVKVLVLVSLFLQLNIFIQSITSIFLQSYYFYPHALSASTVLGSNFRRSDFFFGSWYLIIRLMLSLLTVTLKYILTHMYTQSTMHCNGWFNFNFPLTERQDGLLKLTISNPNPSRCCILKSISHFVRIYSLSKQSGSPFNLLTENIITCIGTLVCIGYSLIFLNLDHKENSGFISCKYSSVYTNTWRGCLEHLVI